MKKYNKHIIKIFISAILAISLCVSGLAMGEGNNSGGYSIPPGANPMAYIMAYQMVTAQTSSYDFEYGIAQDVAVAKLAYAAAKQTGDMAGMEAAHATAEAARAAAGNYSGGPDGSEFIPLGTPSQEQPSYTQYPYYPGYQGYPPYPGDWPGYVPPTSYTITASASEGGSISPGGTKTISSGSNQEYQITSNTGFKITDVIVDGASMGAVSTYTFSNISSNHTITAEFERLTYSITATAGNGGSISPSGKSTVNYGDSLRFMITANSEYDIKDVKVDGVSIGIVNNHIFSNVTGNHTINVAFVPSGYANISDTSLQDKDGTSLNGNTIKSGYGIFAKVTADYEDVHNVSVKAQYNFGFGLKTVNLTETSSGVFQFPINAGSTQNYRCVYIPVETQDGTYTIIYTISAADADGNILTDTKTNTFTVKGNMYEDDFTGDS